MQSTVEHCLAENLKHKFAWKKNYHKIINTVKKDFLKIKAQYWMDLSLILNPLN